MRPYSMDLRERVAAAEDEDEDSQREIARLFRVSVSFVSRLLQRRREKGTLAPEPHGGGPTPVLSQDDQQRLEELIQEHNDSTLDQLRQQGGFVCSLTTIWRALRRCGLTSKKKTQHADERDRVDVQQKRRSFRRKVKQVEPNRLVFVDETGVTTAMARAYGWAPRGERAVGSAPGSWESLTVIATLGVDGVRAPLVFPPDARGPARGPGRLCRGSASRPRRRRSVLAADLELEATRPVLQCRSRQLRPSDPAQPRRAGPRARRPRRGGPPLEAGSRSLPGQRRGARALAPPGVFVSQRPRGRRKVLGGLGRAVEDIRSMKRSLPPISNSSSGRGLRLIRGVPPCTS